MRHQLIAVIITAALCIMSCGQNAQTSVPGQEAATKPATDSAKVKIIGTDGEKEMEQGIQNYGSSYAYSETERLMQEIAEAVPAE